jgi:exodeoxyribonuclease VII large subunit
MYSLSSLAGGSEVWSVSEINRYVRGLIEADYRLQDIWVRGEVSNVSKPASGHLYFTLKDSDASLGCVMWKAQIARSGVLPQDGDLLEVRGHLGVYEAGGQYQLYADAVRRAGEGDLYRAFIELKTKLEAEGLFDEARKRALPSLPKRIGVVTSASGAALQDVLDVLARRYPLAHVLHAPSRVQGAQAAAELRRALIAVQKADADVILLVRGGGSIEDLAAFNDEALARALAASSIPIVSGVGHETDFTIADFVADVRAPTPSAAAEIATPDRDQLLADVGGLGRALELLLSNSLDGCRRELIGMNARLVSLSPRSRLANERQRLDETDRRRLSTMSAEIRLRRSRLEGLVKTLGAVGPGSILARGYAIVRNEKDEVIRSLSQLEIGQGVNVRLEEGGFGAEVKSINPDREK